MTRRSRQKSLGSIMMIPRLADISGAPGRLKWFSVVTGGQGCEGMFMSIWILVIYVKGWKSLGINPMESWYLFNHQRNHGRAYLWTSLLGYHRLSIQSKYLTLSQLRRHRLPISRPGVVSCQIDRRRREGHSLLQTDLMCEHKRCLVWSTRTKRKSGRMHINICRCSEGQSIKKTFFSKTIAKSYARSRKIRKGSDTSEVVSRRRGEAGWLILIWEWQLKERWKASASTTCQPNPNQGNSTLRETPSRYEALWRLVDIYNIVNTGSFPNFISYHTISLPFCYFFPFEKHSMYHYSLFFLYINLSSLGD